MSSQYLTLYKMIVLYMLKRCDVPLSKSQIYDFILEDELITVYYGADVSEEDAKNIAQEIESQYEDCDVEYHNGGQPLYYYLISVE